MKILSIEKLFPNVAARSSADQAIDKLDNTLPMTYFLDAWEAEYYRIAKKSPFRKGQTP